MRLTDHEKKFLAKRMKLIRAWPLIGVVLLVLVTGLGIWLFLYRPLLANPFVVLSSLGNQSLEVSNLTLMAAMLPIVVLTCLVLTLVMVIFTFAALRNEKKHIAVIQRLAEKQDTDL